MNGERLPRAWNMNYDRKYFLSGDRTLFSMYLFEWFKLPCVFCQGIRVNRLQRGEGEKLESCVSEKKGRGASKRRCLKLELKHVGRIKTLGRVAKI
jgi:hypothetical protein